MTTESTSTRLSLADKINRLFDVYRTRDESEQTAEFVASAISRIIGRDVSSEQVEALRYSSDVEPDPEVVYGMIQHFAIPSDYLMTNGPRADRVDQQLRLLVAARDAGVKRLALRGGSLDPEVLRGIFDAVKLIPVTKI